MINITKRMVCDHCGAQGPEALESEDPVLLAKAEGWICGDEDLCPGCAAKDTFARN